MEFFNSWIKWGLNIYGIKTKNLILIHEYVGLILILSIFLHSIANLKPFKSYFAKEKELFWCCFCYGLHGFLSILSTTRKDKKRKNFK